MDKNNERDTGHESESESGRKQAVCMEPKHEQCVNYFPGMKERRKTLSKCISHMFLFMHARYWEGFDNYCDYISRKYQNNLDFSALLAIYKADKLRLTGRVDEARMFFSVIERLIRRSSDVACLSVRYLTFKAFTLHDSGQHAEARSLLGQAVQLGVLQKDNNPTTCNMTIYAYSGLIHHTDAKGYVPSSDEIRKAELYFELVPEKHTKWLEDLSEEPKVQEMMENSLVPWTCTDYIFILLRTCPDKGFVHFDEFDFPLENLNKAIKCTKKLSHMKLNAKCLIRFHLIQCDTVLRKIKFERNINKVVDMYAEAKNHAEMVYQTCLDIQLCGYAKKCMDFRLDYIDEKVKFVPLTLQKIRCEEMAANIFDTEAKLLTRTIITPVYLYETRNFTHRDELTLPKCRIDEYSVDDDDPATREQTRGHDNTLQLELEAVTDTVDPARVSVFDNRTATCDMAGLSPGNITHDTGLVDARATDVTGRGNEHTQGTRAMSAQVLSQAIRMPLDCTRSQVYEGDLLHLTEQLPLNEAMEKCKPCEPHLLNSHEQFLIGAGIDPFCRCTECEPTYARHLAECLECAMGQTDPKSAVSQNDEQQELTWEMHNK